MRYVAAYLLAALGGNKNPQESDIKQILSTVGIECDPERLEKVVNELSGKSIDEVIAAGRQKLASVPSGGAVAAAGGGGGAAPAAEAATEEKKEEEKKEESEESDDDMGFGLFD